MLHACSGCYNAAIVVVGGESGVVPIVPVGQTASGQSTVQQADASRLQLLAGRDADGWWRLTV